jgi:hypothetical protein
MNFDTAIIVHEPQYVHRLLQHGKALYGKHHLESFEAMDRLEVSNDARTVTVTVGEQLVRL